MALLLAVATSAAGQRGGGIATLPIALAPPTGVSPAAAAEADADPVKDRADPQVISWEAMHPRDLLPPRLGEFLLDELENHNSGVRAYYRLPQTLVKADVFIETTDSLAKCGRGERTIRVNDRWGCLYAQAEGSDAVIWLRRRAQTSISISGAGNDVLRRMLLAAAADEDAWLRDAMAGKLLARRVNAARSARLPLGRKLVEAQARREDSASQAQVQLWRESLFMPDAAAWMRELPAGRK